MLYTGDYSMEDDRHLMAAEMPSTSPDVLIVEATYGVQARPSSFVILSLSCLCLVLSCLVLSCFVLSCLVLSCLCACSGWSIVFLFSVPLVFFHVVD